MPAQPHSDLAAFWRNPANAKGLIEATTSPGWELFIVPFLNASIETCRTKLEDCAPAEMVGYQTQIAVFRTLLSAGRTAEMQVQTERQDSATAGGRGEA